MGVSDFLTGICAMAVLCTICDILTPDGGTRSCTRTVIGLAFLLFTLNGITSLIGL